jgi:hypothetical protein
VADSPIACSLTLEALRARREGLLAALVRRARGHESTSDGLRLRFAADSETLTEIARAVDAERQCCRFLRLVITVEPDGGTMILDLIGPAGTREFLAALLDL